MDPKPANDSIRIRILISTTIRPLRFAPALMLLHPPLPPPPPRNPRNQSHLQRSIHFPVISSSINGCFQSLRNLSIFSWILLVIFFFFGIRKHYVLPELVGAQPASASALAQPSSCRRDQGRAWEIVLGQGLIFFSFGVAFYVFDVMFQWFFVNLVSVLSGHLEFGALHLSLWHSIHWWWLHCPRRWLCNV